MRGLLRFVLIYAASQLLARYLTRFVDRMAAKSPPNSLRADVFSAFGNRYSSSVIRAFGEAAGDLVLGPSSKGRGKK